MTDNNQADHPCLPGGLIPLEQWRVPETSVRRTIRSGLRDILDQLKAGIHPDEQAFRSLDDLPTLSERQIQDYAPVPDREELARALLNELEQLRRSGGQSRKASFLVAPPFSGIAEALGASGRRVIAPPDNLLMPERDITGWWDHQLQDDDWVIPELADFWLRHRSGLGLLRELLARLARDKVGEGIIGCSSWCWQFWAQYLPELHLAPLTPSPLSGDRLTNWLGHLAGERSQGPLTARMTQDGLYVLPAPTGDDERKYSLFTRDLATLARGNPGVALAIWRRTLRARPEDEAQQQGEGDAHQEGRQCWVAPLDQLSLPAVPQSSARQSGYLLHALLMHGGLSLGQLELTSGLPGEELRIALSRLERADVVTGDEQEGIFRVQALAYPAVRRYLQSKGYPVDSF
ncbi:MAG: hypothetical protein NZ764_03090 [Marinobacter nauticus]|nr:hypothetical protein [Marinobacter nauticus]